MTPLHSAGLSFPKFHSLDSCHTQPNQLPSLAKPTKPLVLPLTNKQAKGETIKYFTYESLIAARTYLVVLRYFILPFLQLLWSVLFAEGLNGW